MLTVTSHLVCGTASVDVLISAVSIADQEKGCWWQATCEVIVYTVGQIWAQTGLGVLRAI